jgi:hypothetical protein
MSIEKFKSKVIDLGSSMPTIEIKPHPKEILDLDEETVAIARAKLAGVDFDEIYGDEDRTSPELMIRTQALKIRELFRTPEELKRAFSSPNKIKESLKDLVIDGIDLEFVKAHCVRRQIRFDSDAQALLAVGFDQEQLGSANV